MLYVQELLFDDWNEDHIAQHSVIPEDVEEVCLGDPFVSKTRQRRLRVIGQRPLTLLVPTVTIRTDKQRRLFYEHAAEGISLAIKKNIETGFLPEESLDSLALIANVFVHPAASIAKRVAFNNYKAANQAIRKAIEGRPTLAELFGEKESARHPFRYAP